MKRIVFFGLIYLASCTTACTRQYLDHPAPAGNPPPPAYAAVSHPVIQEIPRYNAKLPPRGGYAKKGSSAVTGVTKTKARQTAKDFQSEYKRQGGPKIAIFLNRQLSAEVRQWRTSERTVISGKGEIGDTTQNAFTTTTSKTTGDISAYDQKYIEEVKRRAPSESYLWAYEDGFMQQLLQSGVYLLDRATIMRLNAVNNGQGSAYDPLSVKRVEINSLTDNADIFVELLISKSSSTPYGYEFKAVAKEVKTGRILANTTSLNWNWSSTKGYKAVADNSGYKLKKTVTLPPLTKISADLATSMMADLARMWGNSQAGTYNHTKAAPTKTVQKKEIEEVSPAPTVTSPPPSVTPAAKPGKAVAAALAIQPLHTYGKFYALLIGITDYKNMTPLKTALTDAEDIAKLLRDQYGYEVQVLRNPGREEIIDSMTEYRKKLSSEDNFLLYYAGHGWLDPETKVGYWLPADASLDSPAQWISNATLTDSIKALRAKHVMVVADSCYSGTLTRSIVPTINKRYDSPEYWDKLSQKKARVVLTSGGNEPVSDTGTLNDSKHSVFASALIGQLQDNDNIIDGNGLYQKLRRNVIMNSNQTPSYSDLRMAGHDGGDFIFVKGKVNE